MSESELRGFDLDAAEYRKDGMPEEVIAQIRELRAGADRSWDRGDKSWADSLHREADRVRDAWYAKRRL